MRRFNPYRWIMRALRMTWRRNEACIGRPPSIELWQHADLVALRRQGCTFQALGRHYGVDPKTVSHLLRDLGVMSRCRTQLTLKRDVSRETSNTQHVEFIEVTP